MIGTIRTIGAVAMLLAGLVLTLCIRDNLAADSPTAQLRTAVERFGRRTPRAPSNDDDRISPLIRQAQAFALYLNPPSAPLSPQRQTGDAAVAGKPAVEPTVAMETPAARPASSSPNFELHGISYYRANPNQSMAMICEQGGARRWVREGDQVGHILVERIENDCIIYRDGIQSQTMALASSEAIAGFAQKVDTSPKVLKPSSAVSQGAAAPIPIRGMRQIPLSRVAAKLGQSSLEKALPSPSEMEAQ